MNNNEQPLSNKWLVVKYEKLMHVIPENDTKEHLLDCKCWCCPVEEDEALNVWVHYAADEREKYENKIKKLN
jgi:nicotinamide mononucleotide adenylyltransferase